MVILIALLFRTISINQSLWLDEATTALVSQRTVADYLTNFAPGDFHPPIYYLLSIAASKLLGTSEVALRSISLIAGVLTVYFVYKIANVLSNNRNTGLLAGLFLATSGLHIYYSQEARMYMLAALFAVLSVHFFTKNSWKLFGVSIAAMVLTHYVTLFMLPIFVIYGLCTRKTKIWWRHFLLSLIMLVVGFAMWLPMFTKQLTGGMGVESSAPLWWSILGKTTPKEIVLVPAKFLFGRITIENDILYAVLTGVVGLIIALIIIKRPYDTLKVRPFKIEIHDKSLIVCLWFLVPFILTAMMGLWIPVFSYFRLLFILPALYILLATGLEALPKKVKLLAIIFVLLVNVVSSGVYLFTPRFHREDWKGLEHFVWQQSKGKRTQLVFVSDSQMEAYSYYFYKNRWDSDGHGADRNFAGPKYIEQHVDTIFLMRYVQPIFDPDEKVRKEVENRGYTKVSEHDFNGIVVWRYAR